MKDNLVFFVFVSFFVGQIDGLKKSKFMGFNEKPFGLTSDNNGDVPDGPFCKSLTAYYVGILQNKHSNKSYDVQFQLKLWVDDEKRKIHVYADKWNEKYSKSEDFELDFYYGGNREWCFIYDDNCMTPFAKRETNFKLDLNTASGNYYHLLNFNFFNNTFGLNKPMEKCTKHQLDTLNDDYTPDLSQLGFCVCCDEYEPDELLVCPSDKWANEKTTQKPLKTTEKQMTTTKKPIKTTTISLVPHDQTCQKIIGYYVGKFQAQYYHYIRFDAQFQIEFDLNLKKKKFYFGITNQSYSNNNDDYLKILIDDHPGENYYCERQGKLCSAPFVNSTVERNIAITTPKVYWWLDILQFPSFKNSFTLNNAIAGCTKHQPIKDEYDHEMADPSLFSYCLCCDEYNPHPSLNCPTNPWQGL